MLEAILERCAGLDVHQETVVACVLTGPLDRTPKSEIQTFGTMTHEKDCPSVALFCCAFFHPS
jgi:transposase